MAAPSPTSTTATEAAGTAPTVRFTTTLFQEGKTATGIVVPDELVEQLGHGKKPPVRVTLGDHTYASTVAVMGGRFLVPVSAANREAAGVAAGDEVEVTLVLDTAPRVIEIPTDLAAALDPAARAFLDGLSPSQQKWHVTQVEGAKTDETRQRRIARSVELLSAGKAR
jgi:hypothetical protein